MKPWKFFCGFTFLKICKVYLSFSKKWFTFEKNITNMKNLKLFPNGCKKIGWFILIPSLLFGVSALLFTDFFSFENLKIPVFYNSGFFFGEAEEKGFFKKIYIDLAINISGSLILIGGMLVGFSKEKVEDEYISSLRLKAVLWSLVVSYSIIFILFITIFGTLFLSMMIVAMYLPLLLYNFRFQYLLFKNRGQ